MAGHEARAPHQAMRGDDVEAWLKARRDAVDLDPYRASDLDVRAWHALDDLLDDYRLHADTGTPLSEEVRTREPG